MRRFALALLTLGLLSACSTGDKPLRIEQAPEQRMFTPVKMRLHPIFSGIKDWTGDGQTDGVEAEVEFLDRFGDPTKASGRLIFELYNYREGYPDPRGDRVVNPFAGSLLTAEEQQIHWNRTSRTYSFKLAYPAISTTHRYVLTAIFEPVSGPRMFDRIVLKGEESRRARPASQPTTR